jgi:hypothetical protein
MVDFLPCHSYRSKDGCVYNKARKTYTRKHPAKTGWNKISFHPRENAAIIKLRRLGYSQNIIAEFLGRSLSHINKIVKQAEMLKSVAYYSIRKLTGTVRRTSPIYRRKTLMKLWAAWESFILGETDKPP